MGMSVFKIMANASVIDLQLIFDHFVDNRLTLGHLQMHMHALAI